MKKAAFVLSLTVVLVMGLAGSAYAITGSGYLAPTGSPHGGYTTSSKKCAVCHAVHHAENAGEVLMRDSVANACVYCHISTNTGVVQIYNGVASNYNGATDLKNAHSVAGSAQCTSCHTPHGAASMIADNAYLRTKILKTSTGVSSPINAGDANEVAVSKWCTNCHTYYETSYDGGVQTSHVMTMASANYPGGAAAKGTYTGKVAWSNSDTCRACHADGSTDAAASMVATVVASSFPHYTAGQRFLTAAGNDTNSVAAVSATDSSADGVCIRCHVSSGVGVGQTF